MYNLILHYLGTDCKAFVLTGPNKAPIGKAWNSPDNLRTWEEAQKARRLGQFIGVCSPRLLVVDIDCQDRGPFIAIVASLENAGHAFFWEYSARGGHIFFRAPEHRNLSSTGITVAVPGSLDTVPIDYRQGYASQCVLAYTRKDIPDYRWGISIAMAFDDSPLGPAPDWLLPGEEAKEPRLALAPRPRTIAPNSSRVERWAESILDALTSEIASSHEGCRNATLNRAAVRAYRVMMAAGLDLAEGIVQLQQAAAQNGLGQLEISKTLKSAQLKAERDGPAEIPIDITETKPIATSEACEASHCSGDTEPNPFRDITDIDQFFAAFADAKGTVKYTVPRVSRALELYGVQFDTFRQEYTREGKLYNAASHREFFELCERNGLVIPAGHSYIGTPLEQIRTRYDSLHEILAAERLAEAVMENMTPEQCKDFAEQFFIAYCNAQDIPFNRAAGCYFLTALAGRALASEYDPCKADIVLALVGSQGSGKTTLTKELCLRAGHWNQISFAADDLENYRAIQGKTIVEIPELTGYSKKELTAIKQFITADTDYYRELYQAEVRAHVRRCVFVITTNEHNFLRDSTGERRYCPVEVGQIEHDLVQQDLQLIWGVGLALYARHGVMYQNVEALQAEHNEQYKVPDPWEEKIGDWLRTEAPSTFRSCDVLDKALGLQSTSTIAQGGKVATILNMLGYESRMRKIGGVAGRWWSQRSGQR